MRAGLIAAGGVFGLLAIVINLLQDPELSRHVPSLAGPALHVPWSPRDFRIRPDDSCRAQPEPVAGRRTVCAAGDYAVCVCAEEIEAMSGGTWPTRLVRHGGLARDYDPHVRSFAQEPRGFLGRRGIDVEAGSPLESRHFGELGHHLDVPVVMIVDFFADGRRVDDEVVGGKCERRVQPRKKSRSTWARFP